MKRQLGLALRTARKESGLTQKEAAAQLSWSAAKINRIEQGAVSVSPADVRALLQLYQTVDQKQAVELIDLAQALLKQDARPSIDGILSEDVIGHAVSDPVARLHQLARLESLSKEPQISLPADHTLPDLSYIPFQQHNSTRNTGLFGEEINDLLYLEGAGREIIPSDSGISELIKYFRPDSDSSKRIEHLFRDSESGE
jgi:transcriptional regulator with XRE-family HTH domain